MGPRLRNRRASEDSDAEYFSPQDSNSKPFLFAPASRDSSKKTKGDILSNSGRPRRVSEEEAAEVAAAARLDARRGQPGNGGGMFSSPASSSPYSSGEEGEMWTPQIRTNGGTAGAAEFEKRERFQEDLMTVSAATAETRQTGAH